MKHQSILKSKAVYVLRLVLGLLAFAAGGLKPPALDVVVEQLEIMGPRQWLWLMTGSVGVSWSWSAIAPIRRGREGPRVEHTEFAPANDNAPADELARAS
jgi:hypothetical protein